MMLRNCLAAALRHLHRGKLYAAIAVFGLSAGLCATLLAALYIRGEYSLEHFVPGYEDAYQLATETPVPGRPDSHSLQTPQMLAALIRQHFPETVSVSRVASERVTLRRGDPGVVENAFESPLTSVDRDFFTTLPLAVVAGDPVAALARPDTVVMTNAVARRIFGDENPLGRVLQAVRGEDVFALTVGAVIADIPPYGSRLFEDRSVFVSSDSAWTRLGRFSHPPADASAEFLRGNVYTYMRLKPGASPHQVRQGLSGLQSQIPAFASGERLDMVRIDRVQTDPRYNPAITINILGVSSLALVILFISSVNFVNLLTARAGDRLLEIGIRKLAGASRAMLAVQFFGEAFLHVAAAVVVAVAMTELLLGHFTVFLASNAGFEYWKDPALLGWMLLGTLLFGLLAGLWPAVVLSGMSPLGAMHGTRLARGSGGFSRQLLVSIQFALLVVLILKAGVTYLQRQFSMRQALRFDTEQVLVLDTSCSPGRMAELRKLAGVLEAGCSGGQLLGGAGLSGGIEARAPDGRRIPMGSVSIDDRMLAIYGVKPIAGRVLTADDFGSGSPERHSTRYLINESAMRALGFDSPTAALGPYPLVKDTPALSGGRSAENGLDEIIGVLPDFSMQNVGRRIAPTVYYADPMQFSTISLKLKKSDVPATLTDINRVWKSTLGRDGDPPVGALNQIFYNDRVERMYYPLQVEERIFGVMALVAVSLALLGLLGLAASAADRRTKEIGIRKALGAGTGDVLKLLLWQFSKPVLWGNLAAWPLAGWALQRWLNGSAYHIDLPLWLFPATALVTLGVALGSVSFHALRVAGARPVLALRCE